jgi:hypothetical protein
MDRHQQISHAREFPVEPEAMDSRNSLPRKTSRSRLITNTTRSSGWSPRRAADGVYTPIHETQRQWRWGLVLRFSHSTSLYLRPSTSCPSLSARGTIWVVLLVLSATAITRMVRHGSSGGVGSTTSRTSHSAAIGDPQHPVASESIDLDDYGFKDRSSRSNSADGLPFDARDHP